MKSERTIRMPEDARNRFEEDVFTYRVTKDGRVLISWEGLLVTTVAGTRATRLIDQVARSDRREAQQQLARETGNFKHGNER